MQAAAPSDSASTDRVSRAVWQFSRRYWQFLVVAMLALLHVVAVRGVADAGARVLVIAHLGLLLLWQPLLRGERALKLSPKVHGAAYLEIQNLTNRANAEEIIYSADFSQQSYLTGLPLLVIAGARFEL